MKIKIEKRLNTPKYLALVVPIISIIVALLIMFIILTIFFMGRLGHFQAAFNETIAAYKELISWPFFNQYGLYSTISKMVPLAFVALGLSFAYKMKIWNIGGEGQLYMGALAATWAALFVFRGITSPILLI